MAHMQVMPSCNKGTCDGLWVFCPKGIICMDINGIKQMWYSPASTHFRIVALPRPSLEKISYIKGQTPCPCYEILIWDLQAHHIPQEQSSPRASDPPKVGQWQSMSYTLRTDAQHNTYVHFINLKLFFSVMSPWWHWRDSIPFCIPGAPNRT